MLKIGLEKEFFVVNGEQVPQLAPKGIPKDDCGWLVEARGEPSADIYQALFSLGAQSAKIKDTMKAKYPNLILDDTPLMKISKELRLEAGRINTKGLVKYQNLYGYSDHATKIGESTAGIHISFTKPCERFVKDHPPLSYNGNFDWPFIFSALDEEFKDEIKAARRRPGFYEVKSDGRVEYRSLPANTNFEKIIAVLTSILREGHW